ncbi:MAG: DUF4925 domain-containing protein [Rikenellaceae bacterium]|nr:DUF4925 domain-containing protein [Rikenellaceae bacterium]
MNKILHFVFLTVAAVFLLSSCDDSDPYYGSGVQSEFNLLYSNRTGSSEKYGTLQLKYSGEEFYGADVYFEKQSDYTANIKLLNVVPGEAALIENVELVPSEGSGYTFGGSATTERGTALKYSGSVVVTEEGYENANKRLVLSLSDVVIPESSVFVSGTYPTMKIDARRETGYNGTFYSMPAYLDWKVKRDGKTESLISVAGIDMTLMVQRLLGSMLYLVLPDITFHKDGNLTVKYAALPDVDMADLMNGNVDAGMRQEINESPKNLVFYNVKRETRNSNLGERDYMYIRINIESLLKIVNIGNINIDLGGLLGGIDLGGDGLDLGEIINVLLDYYPKLNSLLNNGIPFLIEKNEVYVPEYGTSYFYGDYKLYIEENEIGWLIELLPDILDLLGVDLSSLLQSLIDDPTLAPILGPLLDNIVDDMKNTVSVKLGLYLQGENN